MLHLPSKGDESKRRPTQPVLIISLTVTITYTKDTHTMSKTWSMISSLDSIQGRHPSTQIQFKHTQSSSCSSKSTESTTWTSLVVWPPSKVRSESGGTIHRAHGIQLSTAWWQVWSYLRIQRYRDILGFLIFKWWRMSLFLTIFLAILISQALKISIMERYIQIFMVK